MPRPEFKSDIGEEFCQLVASGETLPAACKALGVPTRTMNNWLERYEDFRHAYARAREKRLEAWSERLLEIAEGDDTDVQSRKLKIDTHKWLMSKLAPKKYGDKIEHEHGGDVKISVVKFGDTDKT